MPKRFFRRLEIRPGMPRDFFKQEDQKGYDRPKLGEVDTWKAYDTLNGGFWEGGNIGGGLLRMMLKFFETSNSKRSSFFYVSGFNAPHDPRQSPQAFLDQYHIDSIQLPKNWLSEYPYKDAIGNPKTLRDEALVTF